MLLKQSLENDSQYKTGSVGNHLICRYMSVACSRWGLIGIQAPKVEFIEDRSIELIIRYDKVLGLIT